MANMYGADADELDRLSNQFNATAEELVSEAKQMTSTLNNISWIGDIATAVLDRWNSVNVAHMESATEFLRDAATDLARQAAEQRVASGEGGGGICGVPGLPGGGGFPGGPGIPGGPGGGGFPGSPGGGAGRGGGGGGGGSWGGEDSNGGWEFLQFGGEANMDWGKDGNFIGVAGTFTLAEHGFLGDVGSVKVGDAKVGLGVRIDGTDTMVGAFAEVTAVEVAVNGTVLGDDDLGVTAGASVKALAADASVGYYNGEFGAQAGVNLVSAEGEVGVNVGGVNASVSGEIGLKLEAGFSVGPEGAHFDVGPVSFGISFDW